MIAIPWFSVVCVTIAIATVYYVLQIIKFCLNVRRIGNIVDKLPGDKKHFLFGNLHEHPGAEESALWWHIDLARRHGAIFRFWFGPFRPGVLLPHPSTAKVLLKTTEPKQLSGNGSYNLIRPWLGDGLLISHSEKWHRNRRLLTPAFHFDVLRPYTDVYNDAAHILVTKWAKQLAESPDHSIEIFSPVSLCTLDIVLRCAFSYDDDVQCKDNKYVNAVLSLTKMIVERCFKIHWYIDWLYYRTSHGKLFAKTCDFVHQFADNIIQHRRQALNENPDEVQKRYRDFLDILLLAKDESGTGLTDLEIRNEVDTFLFEGHDTTASAISWCLYNFAKHPDIQQRAREEVDVVMMSKDTPYISCDDLSGLPYLTMCIKESMRMCPPVPFIARELTTPLEVGGVTLPAGTFMDVSIWTIHHNELVWGPDHMEFKPERFDVETMKKMDSHAFVAFSAGPRNCIGQVFAMHELKVVIARVLHSYLMEVDTTHKVEMIPELVLHAKNGIKLHLTPRI